VRHDIKVEVKVEVESKKRKDFEVPHSEPVEEGGLEGK
jgi:hypothetical protein